MHHRHTSIATQRQKPPNALLAQGVFILRSIRLLRSNSADLAHYVWDRRSSPLPQ